MRKVGEVIEGMIACEELPALPDSLLPAGKREFFLEVTVCNWFENGDSLQLGAFIIANDELDARAQFANLYAFDADSCEQLLPLAPPPDYGPVKLGHPYLRSKRHARHRM